MIPRLVGTVRAPAERRVGYPMGVPAGEPPAHAASRRTPVKRYRIPAKMFPPYGPRILPGGGHFFGGKLLPRQKLCRPRGAGRLSHNGDLFVFLSFSASRFPLLPPFSRLAPEAVPLPPLPLWLKEYHGLGEGNFCGSYFGFVQVINPDKKLLFVAF